MCVFVCVHTHTHTHNEKPFVQHLNYCCIPALNDTIFTIVFHGIAFDVTIFSNNYYLIIVSVFD